MTVNKCVTDALDRIGIGNEPLVIAVSGGGDSQALIKCLSHVAKSRNITCIAVGVNHGLRPEADAELDLAEDLSRSVSVEFRRRRVNVRKGASVQAHAREARYAALEEEADAVGARFIATAHHMDDRAETVLIRLLRGKALGSMGVMPTLSGRIVRPMLGLSRGELVDYCRRWDLKFASDPSNDDDKYMRVKVRRQLMPLLEEMSPGIKNRLNDISDEILRLSR